MRRLNLVALLSAMFVFFSCNSQKKAYKDLGDGLFADIETTQGNIIVKLNYKETPITVANFVTLAEGKNSFVKAEYKGKPFYNGTIFHRVIKDFMIQGGDPTGTGMGDPGYRFEDEFVPTLQHDKKEFCQWLMQDLAQMAASFSSLKYLLLTSMVVILFLVKL